MAEKKQSLLPAYVSPGTYRNFIESLRKTGLPARVDKSVPFISSKSGVVQGQLLSSLQFLGLISDKHVPTQRFHDLIDKQGSEDLKRVKQDVVKSSYPFLFGGDFNLEKATTDLVAEAFKSGAKVNKASMIFRCVSFFVALARDAGLKVSPHVNPSNLRAKKGQTKETEDQIERQTPASDQSKRRHQPDNIDGHQRTWQELLLEKFPQFDPSWPDELKKQWFDGFNRLMNDKPGE
ncbi:MAG TPA: DUF5343 domain-containing protein [Acidobacteriota bacterium]|nr:DUF5343 domain-containing protein [Acidobacteriota bacterium]